MLRCYLDFRKLLLELHRFDVCAGPLAFQRILCGGSLDIVGLSVRFQNAVPPLQTKLFARMTIYFSLIFLISVRKKISI